MKEDAIQQNGNQVSVVIYDAPLPPRYFRFSKKFIKFLFVVVPVILGLIFLTLLFWGLATRIKDAPVPSLPEVMSDHDAQVLGLEAEIKSLKESLSVMTDKLSTRPLTAGGGEEPYLMAIKKPYGMQNFLGEKRVNLESFDFHSDQNKVAIKFNILSTNPEKRVTGHVLVFMVSSAGIIGWPAETNLELGQGVKFARGEPFSVSRLRPTNVEFNVKDINGNVKFYIYIFSREGDLLLIKESENYKAGNPS